MRVDTSDSQTQALLYELQAKLTELQAINKNAAALNRDACSAHAPGTGHANIQDDNEFWNDWCDAYDLFTSWESVNVNRTDVTNEEPEPFKIEAPGEDGVPGVHEAHIEALETKQHTVEITLRHIATGTISLGLVFRDPETDQKIDGFDVVNLNEAHQLLNEFIGSNSITGSESVENSK